MTFVPFGFRAFADRAIICPQPPDGQAIGLIAVACGLPLNTAREFPRGHNFQNRQFILRRTAQTLRREMLAADTELLDDLLVAAFVAALDVIEELTTLGHELQKPTAGVVILDVRLEVFGEVGDPFSEDRDLHLRRTRVAGLGSVGLDNFSLAACRNRHRQ